MAVGVVYRPPQSNVTQCVTSLDNVFSHLVSLYDKVVVTGDRNVSHCFNDYNFAQVIDEPTRVTQFSATLINPIFINDIKIISSNGTLNANAITDHRLVFCELHISIKKISVNVLYL